jgi:hypothetical protein
MGSLFGGGTGKRYLFGGVGREGAGCTPIFRNSRAGRDRFGNIYVDAYLESTQ